MGKNKRSASKQPSSEPHSNKKRRGNSNNNNTVRPQKSTALTEHLPKADLASSSIFDKPPKSLVEAHKVISPAPQPDQTVPPNLNPLYGYTCAFTPYSHLTQSAAFTLISAKDAPERVKVDIVLRGAWANDPICDKLLRRQNRRIEFSSHSAVARREPGAKTPLQLVVLDQFLFRIDGDSTVYSIPKDAGDRLVKEKEKHKARKSEGALGQPDRQKHATESHVAGKRHSVAHLPSGRDPDWTVPRDECGQAPLASTSALAVPKVTSEPLFPSAGRPPPAPADINSSIPKLPTGPVPTAHAPRPPYSPSQEKEILQSMQAFEATGLAKEDPVLTSSGEQSVGQQSMSMSQAVSRPQDQSPPHETVERHVRQVAQRSPQKQRPNDRYVGLNADGRVYVPRESVTANVGRINYIGAVVREPIAKSVRGSESNHHMSLFLCDQTGLTTDALNCVLFGTREFLPLEIEVGDVLLLRNIRVQVHGGRPQLVMKSNEQLEFAHTSMRLQGTPQGDKRRHFLRYSRDFDLSTDEKNAIRSVGRWFHDTHISEKTLQEELKKAQTDKINAAPGPRKQKSICQLSPGIFFDLVAEVQYADFARYNPTSDQVGSVDLLLCDYTTHDQLYDRPQSECDSAPAGKLSLKVTCWDRQATQAAKLWHPREQSLAERQRLALPMVRISNSKSKVAGNSILEANVRNDSSKPEKVLVEEVGLESDVAKEILRRKERYFAKVQAEKAAALAAMPVTVPAQCNLLGPEVPLVDVIHKTQTDKPYRTRVRVRDYMPRDIKAWIKNYCPKCLIEQSSVLDGRCALCSAESARAFEFAFLLESADQQDLSVPVIVSDAEAMKFFGTENAEESPSEVSTDGIAEALAPLLGMTAAEVKAGQTIMRSPVFTAGLIAFDKEGQRRWFLAETTLRTSENEVR